MPGFPSLPGCPRSRNSSNFLLAPSFKEGIKKASRCLEVDAKTCRESVTRHHAFACGPQASVQRRPAGASVSHHLLTTYVRSYLAVIRSQFSCKGVQGGREVAVPSLPLIPASMVLPSCWLGFGVSES